MDFTHDMADVEPGVRLHYVTAGEGPRTVVLLHGWPQTWWEWHRVMPAIVGAGWKVVAPDYRGAGHSSRPDAGYDKVTMAGDVQRLLREHLRLEGPVVLVGHDIGLMIAYAYAQTYREEISHLVTVDGTVPGTDVFDRLRNDPRVWHFDFHAARDVAEMLVAGRERQYVQVFLSRTYDPTAISEADVDIYAAAYSASGAMRAGFEVYRAFDRDAEANREALARNGKLTAPVLTVGGDISSTGSLIEETMREVAHNVTGVRIPRTGHWVAEESPDGLAHALLDFIT